MTSPGTKPLILAKIVWEDPQTRTIAEFLLTEGATATIGRLDSNDITIKEEHVSRQHAIINYRDGIFMITDLGSANGVFVNDHKISEPFPLQAGDLIRLYVPQLRFESVFDRSERLAETSTVITAAVNTGKGKLIISNGMQEGQTLLLLRDRLTIGRAIANADWEIKLEDQSVSRPHARLELVETTWVLRDLGSANGTSVNNAPVTEKGRALRDGDVIGFGGVMAVFRVG
ncbi:MAG: FHA domain-containing protein [Chloroflexota bacterium]|nr:FHA domain-containing protein [Chloroflexota bacterium]